jgi:3-methyladenine DNA glycosylase AlkD
MFGVSFANLNALKKKIKTDHQLAQRLWRTGNLDAQWLATMIADPARLTSTEVENWTRDLAQHERALSGLFAGVVAKSPFANEKMRAWMKSPEEFVRACGYDVLGVRLRDGDPKLTDADCRKILGEIEQGIGQAPNWVRYAMNGALIGIGIYRPALTKDAIAAAKRIGKVEVDHGETGCKTPDAIPYIQKALSRAKKRK